MVAKYLTTLDLRRLRQAAGISLDDAGGRIGVSGSYLSRAERGYAQLRAEHQSALCRELERLLEDRRATLAQTSLLIGVQRERSQPMTDAPQHEE